MLGIMIIMTVIGGVGWRSSGHGGREDRCWEVASSGLDTLLVVMGNYLPNPCNRTLRGQLYTCCVI